MKSKQYNKIMYILLLLVGAVFVTICSRTTSPLYHYLPGGDSAIFQTVGKCWAEGMLPYKEIFDHKGPLIFLLNMISYKFLGSRIGIWVFQIISLFITEICFYKILKMANVSDKKSLFGILISMIILLSTYDKGNLTEEYVLPLEALCLYYQLNYLQNRKEHRHWYSFLYGITFAVCFLTRLTNAVPVVCGIFFILVVWIKEKKWKKIATNALFFGGGSLSLIFPFTIYFWVKGSFEDFWFGTIGYNVLYASNMIPWWKQDDLNYKFLIAFLIPFAGILAGLLKLQKKEWTAGLFLAFSSICEIAYFMQVC